MTPIDLFQKLLADNNLTASLTKPKVTFTEDGGILVYPPTLQVSFVRPEAPVIDGEAIVDEKTTTDTSKQNESQ